MPYYAVAKGVNPGIYTSWNMCKQNVNGFKGAKFKKFTTAKQAQDFINDNSSGRARAVSLSLYLSLSLSLPLSMYKGKKPVSYSSYSFESPRGDSSMVDSSPMAGSTPRVSLEGLDIVRKRSDLNFNLNNKYDTSTSKFLTETTDGNAAFAPVKTKDIYVDGASRGNGRCTIPMAGYGVFYGKDDPRNAAVPMTEVDCVSLQLPTNQRAELNAIGHALTEIANEIQREGDHLDVQYIIYSDSKYAQSCLTQWCDNWIKNDWRASLGQPVSNKKLIASIIPKLNYVNDYYNSRGWSNLKIVHVRGHRGNYGNEMADALANLGADDMTKSMSSEES